MKDRNGLEIEAGMTIKHIHHAQTVVVKKRYAITAIDGGNAGDLYAGDIQIERYHSSVIEIIKRNIEKPE